MLKPITTVAFIALLTGTAQANHAQYDMQVDGLTCPFCVATSSKALKKIEGVHDVAVDLETGIISVCASGDTDLSDKRMTLLFRKKGFTYRSQTVSDTCTAANISHSETGEHIISDKDLEPKTKKQPYGSAHDGHGEDHDHSDHDRYGS